MTPKEIVSYFVHSYGIEKINYALQTKHAKELLKKYKSYQITYAIDYYKNLNKNIYSLGWFLYGDNMREPAMMYEAELHKQEGTDSGNRNWRKINQQNSKTKYREEYPCNLFEEPREDN